MGTRVLGCFCGGLGLRVFGFFRGLFDVVLVPFGFWGCVLLVFDSSWVCII